jgi:hypothetical protein
VLAFVSSCFRERACAQIQARISIQKIITKNKQGDRETQTQKKETTEMIATFLFKRDY